MKLNRFNVGISIITLVIAIVIIIIVVGIVFINIIDDKLIDRANESKFKNDIDNFNSQLLLWITNECGETLGSFNMENFNANKNSGDYKGLTIQQIITSMSDEYANKLEIENGKLVYVGENEKEIAWSDNVGIVLPTLSPLNGSIKQISSSGMHNLVLMEDGTIKSWGENSTGQLGVGYSGYTKKIPQAVVSEALDLSVIPDIDIEGLWSEPVMGNRVSVRFYSDEDEDIYNNDYKGFVISKIRYVEDGQIYEEKLTSPIVNLNYGKSESKIFEISKPNATSISVNFSLFDVEEGFDYVTIFDSSNTLVYTYTGHLYLDSLYMLPNTPLTGVKEVFAGMYNSFAIMNDGSVKIWGLNLLNSVDEFEVPISLSPTTITGLSDVKQIVSGSTFNLALMNDGTVKCWGISIVQGEWMNGPVEIPNLNNVKKIGAGLSHYVFLMNDGTVKEWGGNAFGMLNSFSNGDYEDDYYDLASYVVPTTIDGLSGVKDISVGMISNIALMEDGTLKSWGYNMNLAIKMSDVYYDIFGSTFTEDPTQEQLDQLTLALEKLGMYDEEGNPLDVSSNILMSYTETPVLVENLTNIGEISTGGAHLTVTNNDSSSFTYGTNIGCVIYEMLYYFEALTAIFNGATWMIPHFEDVGYMGEDIEELYRVIIFSDDISLQNVKSISTGIEHILVLLKDGTLKSFGNNHYGQLGDGTNIYKITPVTVNVSEH